LAGRAQSNPFCCFSILHRLHSACSVMFALLPGFAPLPELAGICAGLEALIDD
jgi:hypothetical protein